MDGVAKPSVEAIEIRRVIYGAAAVLEDQCNLTPAGNDIERGAQRAFVVVLDFDQAEHPTIGLARGQSVRMRMIPVHRSTIAYVEGVRVPSSRRDRRRGGAVVACIHGQAVPVHDRRLLQRVFEIDSDPLARFEYDRWIDKTRAAMLNG